jgi:hypothetical protein
MTVKRTPLGDVVTTRFITKQNELGVDEVWEEVTISTGRDISDTARMRVASVREMGVAWPRH